MITLCIREREKTKINNEYHDIYETSVHIHLKVSHGAGSVSVGTGLATAFPLLDGGVQVVVFSAAQREGAAVEGRPQNQLVGRAPKVLPQQHTVVLRSASVLSVAATCSGVVLYPSTYS